MAMECEPASARPCRRPAPDSATSAPSMTERRDARHCVTAEEPKGGASEGRMRFVPVLPEFIIGAGPRPGTGIFRAFVALLQARIRLSGKPSVTLPPYFARREPSVRRRSGAVGRER